MPLVYACRDGAIVAHDPNPWSSHGKASVLRLGERVHKLSGDVESNFIHKKGENRRHELTATIASRRNLRSMSLYLDRARLPKAQKFGC